MQVDRRISRMTESPGGKRYIATGKTIARHRDTSHSGPSNRFLLPNE